MKIWTFPEKCISQDWPIFEVNFVHIIHLKTSQRNFTVLNSTRKAHIRRFSKTYFQDISVLHKISSIFGKLSVFNFLWEQNWAILDPIFMKICQFFWTSSNHFFVLLNFILFLLRVSKWIIWSKLTKKCFICLNTEISRKSRYSVASQIPLPVHTTHIFNKRLYQI